jgi:prepilin-type N-terminal cleavage/methylation domain-containing protein
MSRRAFTLIELLVVISIIGLLSTIAVVSLGASKIKARDTRRKADFVQISKALELYYDDNGSYPNTSGGWHGSCSSYGSYPDAYVDSTHDAWVPGLTPTYMKILPRDPSNNKAPSGPPCSGNNILACYVYVSDGIDYKLIAHCTPETYTAGDQFIDPIRPTWAYAISTPGANAKGWH